MRLNDFKAHLNTVNFNYNYLNGENYKKALSNHDRVRAMTVNDKEFAELFIQMKKDKTV